MKDAKSIVERSGMRLRHRNLAAAYLEVCAELEECNTEWNERYQRMMEQARGLHSTP